MADFIIIAICGVASFMLFSFLLKKSAEKYEKVKDIQEKFGKLKNSKLYSNIITFALIIIIVVLREMFDIGYIGYGLLLGGLLSISDFLFNKSIEELEANKKTRNLKPTNKSNKSVDKRNKTINKSKKK